MARLFTVASDETLCSMILSAKERLVLVAPGLSREVARVLADRIKSDGGPPELSVTLDVDPEVCRLGYGDIESLDLLRPALESRSRVLQVQKGARIGVVVSDSDILVYAPFRRRLRFAISPCRSSAEPILWISASRWFDNAKLDLDNFRRWNVCIDYKPDNPKPLGWEIERDRLAVETDILRSQPNVIVAVGVYAMRWCLRARFDLSTVHGRKFEVQIGDHKAVCVPVYHPSTYGRIERAEMGKADVLTVAGVLRGLIAGRA